MWSADTSPSRCWFWRSLTFGAWLFFAPFARGDGERGGGADHRLPLRAGPGDADRDHGGHRPRRRARHPDQGRRGAGDGAQDRHRGARQDGHGHRRQAARDSRDGAGRIRGERSAAPGGIGGALFGTSAGQGDRGGGAGAGLGARRRRASSPPRPATACGRAWRGAKWWWGGRAPR